MKKVVISAGNLVQISAWEAVQPRLRGRLVLVTAMASVVLTPLVRQSASAAVTFQYVLWIVLTLAVILVVLTATHMFPQSEYMEVQ